MILRKLLVVIATIAACTAIGASARDTRRPGLRER